MWGVLHHVLQPKFLLKKLANNFNYLFIREEMPRVTLFEIGKRFSENRFIEIVEETLGKRNTQILKDSTGEAMYVFYQNPNPNEGK